MDLSNFSFSSLLAGLLFGIVGMWLLREAKRRANLYNVVIAVLLMIYPFFVSTSFLTWGVGCALCGSAYYFWDA
jgi:hypothetical protein